MDKQFKCLPGPIVRQTEEPNLIIIYCTVLPKMPQERVTRNDTSYVCRPSVGCHLERGSPINLNMEARKELRMPPGVRPDEQPLASGWTAECQRSVFSASCWPLQFHRLASLLSSFKRWLTALTIKFWHGFGSYFMIKLGPCRVLESIVLKIKRPREKYV